MKKTILLSALAVVALCLTACAKNNEKQEMKKENKVLVAYFSATGTTKAAAETLAKVTGGKLYEIQPEQPYTSADLDWTNKQSRSTLEMKNTASRPAVKKGNENMADYDVIFIGYPIWWDLAPTVVNTFIEQSNLKGKTVIPFATSGGSSINNSEKALRNAYTDINWRDGKLLNGVSEDEMRQWVEKTM